MKLFPRSLGPGRRRARASLGVLVLPAAIVLSMAQGGRQAQAPGGPVAGVRLALGHGDLTAAQQVAAAATGQAPAHELAAALVAIYKGDDTGARTRLQALVQAGAGGDAALELGLLDLRHGQRDAARPLLEPLTNSRSLVSPDDYFLLARAARAIGQFQLANDAYNRIDQVNRADIHTARGDLFLQFHQYGDAATEYQRALQADDRWIPAHLGLAQAIDQDAPDRAEAEMATARKLAPTDPDVWLLSAERAVENQDFGLATEALDRVAKTRPGTAREAALRGAVAYGERRPADVEPAVARVREIDPTSALGDRLASEAAARAYRFADAAAYARSAVAIDPDDAEAQADLGLDLLRTGDEQEARAALERSWAHDKSNVVTKNLLSMLDQLDTFDVVPDGDLIFKFAKDETAVLKPYALPLGELAYKTFREHYGFTPKGPILIEVFPRHDDFAVRTVGLMGLTGALGACFGRVVTMDSPNARPPGDFSWQATEWHELAHVFTLQLSDFRVPRWLTEGMSAYEEHLRNPAWGRELTLEFARNLEEKKTFGVTGLPAAFKRPEDLALGYFEASLVVEHLVDKGGFPGLQRMLRAYATGATDDQAFMQAVGENVDQANASFAAFVEQRYGALAKALGNPPSKVDDGDMAGLAARAAAAPGNFASQWSYGRALFQASEYDKARAPLELAAALAPGAQGSNSPHGLLAVIA